MPACRKELGGKTQNDIFQNWRAGDMLTDQFMQQLLCARHCSSTFLYINFYNLPNDPMRQVLLYSCSIDDKTEAQRD